MKEAKTLQNYQVTWTIDIEATTPKEAARIAWLTYFEHNHIANIFEVKDPSSNVSQIDIEESNQND